MGSRPLAAFCKLFTLFLASASLIYCANAGSNGIIPGHMSPAANNPHQKHGNNEPAAKSTMALNHRNNFKKRQRPQPLTTTTTTPPPPPPPPRVMLVIWDRNGEILEDPHVLLRAMVEEPLPPEHQYDVLPKAKLIPLTECFDDDNDQNATAMATAADPKCDFEMEIGNGVVDIRFRDPYRNGKIEFSYAENAKGARVSYVEDLNRLKIAADPTHAEHHSFHQSNAINELAHMEGTGHERILHLHYHDFKAYSYVYHLNGVVLWMQGDDPMPVIAKEPFVHIEYESDHEYNLNKLPYVIDHDFASGEFRITIRNGYGLDPERASNSEDQKYGNINIAVARDRDMFRRKHFRVYTLNVKECIEASQHFADGKEHPEYSKNNPAQILYLWADKDKKKFGPFPINEGKHPIRLQLVQHNGGGVAMDGTDAVAVGAKCEKPFGSAPEQWADWLKFRDEDNEETLEPDSIPQIVHTEAGTLIVEANLHKTISDGVNVHIDCGMINGENNVVVYELPFKLFNEGNAEVVLSVPEKSEPIVKHLEVHTGGPQHQHDVQQDPLLKRNFQHRFVYTGKESEHPLLLDEFGVPYSKHSEMPTHTDESKHGEIHSAASSPNVAALHALNDVATGTMGAAPHLASHSANNHARPMTNTLPHAENHANNPKDTKGNHAVAHSNPKQHPNSPLPNANHNNKEQTQKLPECTPGVHLGPKRRVAPKCESVLHKNNLNRLPDHHLPQQQQQHQANGTPNQHQQQQQHPQQQKPIVNPLKQHPTIPTANAAPTAGGNPHQQHQQHASQGQQASLPHERNFQRRFEHNGKRNDHPLFIDGAEMKQAEVKPQNAKSPPSPNVNAIDHAKNERAEKTVIPPTPHATNPVANAPTNQKRLSPGQQHNDVHAQPTAHAQQNPHKTPKSPIGGQHGKHGKEHGVEHAYEIPAAIAADPHYNGAVPPHKTLHDADHHEKPTAHHGNTLVSSPSSATNNHLAHSEGVGNNNPTHQQNNVHQHNNDNDQDTKQQHLHHLNEHPTVENVGEDANGKMFPHVQHGSPQRVGHVSAAIPEHKNNNMINLIDGEKLPEHTVSARQIHEDHEKHPESHQEKGATVVDKPMHEGHQRLLEGVPQPKMLMGPEHPEQQLPVHGVENVEEEDEPTIHTDGFVESLIRKEKDDALNDEEMKLLNQLRNAHQETHPHVDFDKQELEDKIKYAKMAHKHWQGNVGMPNTDDGQSQEGTQQEWQHQPEALMGSEEHGAQQSRDEKLDTIYTDRAVKDIVEKVHESGYDALDNGEKVLINKLFAVHMKLHPDVNLQEKTLQENIEYAQKANEWLLMNGKKIEFRQLSTIQDGQEEEEYGNEEGYEKYHNGEADDYKPYYDSEGEGKVEEYDHNHQQQEQEERQEEQIHDGKGHENNSAHNTIDGDNNIGADHHIGEGEVAKKQHDDQPLEENGAAVGHKLKGVEEEHKEQANHDELANQSVSSYHPKGIHKNIEQHQVEPETN